MAPAGKKYRNLACYHYLASPRARSSIRWQVEEHGHVGLNKVVHASTVDQYHDLVVSDRAKKVKGLRCRCGFHSVVVDMRNQRGVGV